MTDRPILFSAPMVRALLDGRKTQTRRVLKHGDHFPNHCVVVDGEAILRNTHTGLRQDVSIPYAIGDRLWVREAFAHVGTCDPGYLLHRTDYPHCAEKYGFDEIPPIEQVKWRPSIHMPRAASRLTLTVTDVRVQRLQDISEADAIAEGVGTIASPLNIAKSDFADLWNSINGPDAWAANPWIVALTFDVHRCNIDAQS